MSVASGVFALALLVATGWWPMRAFGARLAGDGLGGRIGLALALGAAATGFVQLVLSLLGLATGWFASGVLAVASLALVAARVGSSDDGRSPRPRAEAEVVTRARRLDRLVIGVVLVVACVSCFAGVGTPFRADGGKFWAPRARELAVHPVAEAPSLVDADAIGFHRDYPLLVPLLLAPVFERSPPDATSGPKLVLAGFACALLLLAGSLLLREGPAGRLLLLAFGTLPAWTSLDVRESLVAGGYVDVPLALFLLVLVDAVDRVRRGVCCAGDVVLAAIAAGALVATKLEGAAELVIVLVAWMLAGPRRGLVGWIVGGAALLAVPTLLLRGVALSSPPIADPGLLLDGGALLARSLPLLAGLAAIAFDASVFGLLPLLLVAVAWRARPALGRFVPLLVLGMLAFMACVYLATTMHLGRHLLTSAHRLAFHGLPALCVLVARGARLADEPAQGGSEDASAATTAEGA
ncbi:MAG: hypothetical protein H6825_00775 [Planctomycetes bacterium]|nr:hypothetical protein [Planctomycetota bacterium]